MSGAPLSERAGAPAHPVARQGAHAAPRRAGTRQGLFLAAAGAALVTRVVTLVAIAVGARHHHVSFSSRITVFDGRYYHAIATHGYPHHLEPGLNPADYFPGFPVATRPLLSLGLPFWAAALVVVTVATLVAAGLIALTVARYTSPAVGLVTACLFAVTPLAGVLSLAYSEALMSALAAGCLLALVTRRWLTAGVLAALAGFTRPTGAVLVACCLAAAVVAVARDRDWRSVAAVVVAPVGSLGALAWIGISAGRWNAFFTSESRGGRGNHFDGGADTVRAIYREITDTGPHHYTLGREYALYTFVVVALILWAAWRRPPLVMTVFSMGLFAATVLTAHTQPDVARFLLPAFPMLVPLGELLVRWRREVTLALLAAACVGSAAIGAYYAVFYTPSPFPV